MIRKPRAAEALAERLCRAQRVGLFGQRGVGKTTLLTMLYREAVGGRLPDLRLAAAAARTASYLSDKILQLEAGQPLPATLAETELRFNLYSGGRRLELVVRDYQGEHVALGRREPIRDFLRDCDAVWLCLDASPAGTPAERLRAQQEVEQMVEDYLAVDRHDAVHRPMALLLTKADLLSPQERFLGPDADQAALEALVDERFDMTRHALRTHCPCYAPFAVSSLGKAVASDGTLKPAGLDAPLAWLVRVLETQDNARLRELWQAGGKDLTALRRAVEHFARRYPQHPEAAESIRRLRELTRRRSWRRGLTGVGAAACLVVGLWTYDAAGAASARRFEADHAADLPAVRHQWDSFRAWHPTRNLLSASAATREQEHLRQLDRQIEEARCAERLTELRRRADDPDTNPEDVWRQFQAFRTEFPDADVSGDVQQLRAKMKTRRDAARERLAEIAFADLQRDEKDGDLPALVRDADDFLRDYPDSVRAEVVRRHRETYLRQIDQRDMEAARAYSAKQPLNFPTRREQYQRYLQRHPDGAFADEARTQIRNVEADWDKHDFRAVADHFQQHPGDIKELDRLCHTYLAAHPDGRFKDSATELLRFGERVTRDGEYKVTLRSGDFDHSVRVHPLSRGPSLAVEVEVNGVRHGPSNIVARRYDPDWDYEFPRLIRWKMGDSVRIVVTDHYYWNRTICEITSDANDPFALRLLSGEVCSGKHRLVFESDFHMPVLPKIE
jgi:hypothetical protein